MATAQEAIHLADTQIGTKENPAGSNRQKFGEAYGWNGVFWCMQFVWWVLDKLGVDIIKTASTRVAASWFEAQGRLITNWANVIPGDVCFWNFDARPNALPNIEHVSIAAARPAGATLPASIEGNTSATNAGSQDNGGMVAKKSRPEMYFVCAGRPKYSPKPVQPGKLKKHELERGDKGSDVRLWQHLLNVVDKADLKVDGHFGVATEEATKAWQKAHDKKADGKVWPDTIHALEMAVAAL